MAINKQPKQWWRNKVMFSTDYEEYLGSWDEIIQQYKEMLEVNGQPVPKDEDISEDTLWRYIDDQIKWYYEDFVEEMPDKMVVCHASIGRWNGSVAGGECGTLRGLLQEAGAECDDIRIKYEGPRLILEGSHHDGTNYYCFRELTRKGQQWYEQHQDGPRSYVCEYLFNTKGMSRNIPYWM